MCGLASVHSPRLHPVDIHCAVEVEVASVAPCLVMSNGRPELIAEQTQPVASGPAHHPPPPVAGSRSSHQVTQVTRDTLSPLHYTTPLASAGFHHFLPGPHPCILASWHPAPSAPPECVHYSTLDAIYSDTGIHPGENCI